VKEKSYSKKGEKSMKVIIISVKFQITMNTFPLKLVEIFIAIKAVLEKVGHILVQELLKQLEEETAKRLKDQGFVRCGYKERIIQSCLGKIHLRFLRLRSPDGVVRYGVSEQVEVPAYSRITEDAFEPALGLLPHVSYRRSSMEGSRILGSGPGKSSLHRRLKEIASEVEIHPTLQAKGYQYLIVDGTGAKFQDSCFIEGQRKVKTYPGELRTVYASKDYGKKYEVIGRWTNTSWQDIAKEVYQRINGKDIQILISDGGAGIEEAFRLPHMQHQRCSVHAWRELRVFLYQDGAKKNEQEPFHLAMKKIPVFGYAKKEVMEKLKPPDTTEIENAVKVSEEQLISLQGLLESKGYPKTATYVAGLSSTLLTFLKEWLTTGQICPATSNIAENRFSLVKNRIRVGRRWSEPGLIRWLDLSIHKIFPSYNWNKLWEKLLPVSTNITCEIIAVY
jgi:hypothetical protein